jgi:hypothetical protein
VSFGREVILVGGVGVGVAVGLLYLCLNAQPGGWRRPLGWLADQNPARKNPAIIYAKTVAREIATARESSTPITSIGETLEYGKDRPTVTIRDRVCASAPADAGTETSSLVVNWMNEAGILAAVEATDGFAVITGDLTVALQNNDVEYQPIFTCRFPNECRRADERPFKLPRRPTQGPR